MDARIGRIETEQAVMSEKISGMKDEMTRRFGDFDRRFDEMGRKLDKLPTQWDMAKVVFFVVGALMAAAIWGPRALALLGHAAP